MNTGDILTAYIAAIRSLRYATYLLFSVMDPKLFLSDPDPTLQLVSGPYLDSNQALHNFSLHFCVLKGFLMPKASKKC